MEKAFAKLHRAFNPQSIAVVGDKREFDFMWLRAQSTFQGKLYSVQIDPREIGHIKELGVENYTSLLDIQGPVDLVIVAVPRAVAPRILEDCINKRVGAAHFFTAGFAETDTEEGRKLERLLSKRAREANFCLIGPNCMGVSNPRLGVRQSAEQHTSTTGVVGFISQSGTHAITFSIEGHLQGVDINKSVSFGNGIALDSTDYLDYFGRDTDIKAVGMYLEGVRDGGRFLAMLREVSARKPVVIWKGGQTEEGARAIASHTGSLAIPQAVWDAALMQAGAIRATKSFYNIERNRNRMLTAPPEFDLGIWALFGVPDIHTTNEPSKRGFGALKGFHGLCGFGFVRGSYSVGNYDFLDFKVKIPPPK